MKLKLLIILILVSLKVSANEIEVIELHENKSLDQMVLDQIETESQIENPDFIEENLVSDEDPEINNSEDNTQLDNDIKIKEDIRSNLDDIDIKNIFINANEINSSIIQNEFNNYFLNLNFENNVENSQNIFYQVVNYFYIIGDIAKAYKLIDSRDLDLIEDENQNFFNLIKINYLLSTYQLEDVCRINNSFADGLNATSQIIDKLEIFCLILENKISEAELLNSIIQETENESDENFQALFSILLNKEQNYDTNNFSLKDTFNPDLIFLYSAMARIGQIPLNKKFLEVDPDNLAIPIILNKSSPIDLRIKAANESYRKQLISTESLAALYQSVDFDSQQLNNPELTIKNLSNNIDIIMSFYFQLVNIQIFPSERLEVLLKFWNFAKINDLEDIAYSLSYNILNSIEISSEYVNYSLQISLSYLYNKDFENSLKWINFYEQVNGIDEKSSYVRILLDLYSSKDISSFIDIIKLNSNKLIGSDNKEYQELIYILFYIFDEKNNHELAEHFEKIYDVRLMPSLFITENIKNSIENNNNVKFLFYTSISLNKKMWKNIHPDHLKLILIGFSKYKDGIYLKDIIIEVFENYKIL